MPVQQDCIEQAAPCRAELTAAVHVGGGSRTAFVTGPTWSRPASEATFLGDGSLTHKLVETAVGLFMQSPKTYAKRMVPLLFAEDLEGRTGLMFGHKAQPILPTPNMLVTWELRYLPRSLLPLPC